MADSHETTFGRMQIDERFKKLQHSLKLAILKQERSKSAHAGKAPPSVTRWPSISSINVDPLNFSSAAPSVQNSLITSEVLASSSNLKNILRKNSRDMKQETMTTSSIRQHHVQQEDHIDRLAMPPPPGRTVYRAFKEPQNRVRTLSDYERTDSTLLNRSVPSSVNTFSLKSAPSWISTNTNAGEKYSNTFVPSTAGTNSFQKIDRVFSKWRVMLNDRCELIIKGTLECGKIARSKPVIRIYSATCVESKYKHKYILQGNIVDERHVLPDYVRGKFYNGFPDDWENVYQIWRTYVSKGCPVTFHWPTPITDSDDDLKSEMTDLTFISPRDRKTIPAMGSCNLNDCTKTENLSNIFEKKEKYQNYSTHSSQSYKKNTSFVKSYIPNSKKDVIPVIQTSNVKSPYNEDNRRNVNPPTVDVNPLPSSKKINKLKDILQEDKLNIIINNLADRNCSPQYVDKILEMFDCLDYAMSYKTGSDCTNNSIVPVSYETYDSETAPLQQNLMYDSNHANAKLENKWTELKNYGHSTDLGYGSIRNDATQLSNPVNVKSKHDNDSENSENETYAGVPKISMERVLKAREMSRKICKRKARKKTVYPDVSKHTSNLPYNTNEIESIHVTNSVANSKKNLISDDSCISITEDEVTSDTREYCKIINTQKPQEIFSSRREMHKNNCHVYEGDKFVTHVQNEQPFDAYEAQKVNLNVFIKEQKIPGKKIQENSQFVTDVDYTSNSDVDVVTVSTNSRKYGRSMIRSHAKMDQEEITIISESNNNFPEKSCISPKLRREFVEQTKSETAMKRSKPTIISSVPVNLKLRINRAGLNTGLLHNSKTINVNDDKQGANVSPVEETDKNRSMPKMSVATKPAINDSHSKTITIETNNDKREICPITNNENESSNLNSNINSTTNPTMTNEQSKSNKLREENPKVLDAWTPKVVYHAKSKSELGLIFQGKLLNEAGHVVHRKFTTDLVVRRLSTKLIQTVNDEFYKLLGPLNDNKRTIPKELVRQCYYGCPTKIEQFCLTWKTLENDNIQVEEKLHNATIDSLNTPISSRGRRILPPLCYWTGERITLKDNNPVYSPGNSQESSLLSTDTSKEIKKHITITEERKNQKVNSKNISKKQSVNKQILSPKSNKTSETNKDQMIIIEKVSKNSPKIKIANNVKRFSNAKKFQKSVRNKRRVTQNVSYSTYLSSTSSEEEQVSPRKHRRKSQTNENADPEVRYTLRKRQKIETSSNRVLRRDTVKSRHTTHSPTKKLKNQDLTYIYYQNIPQSENFLSEIEESSV